MVHLVLTRFSLLIASVGLTITLVDSFGLSLYPNSHSNKAVIDTDLSRRTLLSGAEQNWLSKSAVYRCLRFTGLSYIYCRGWGREGRYPTIKPIVKENEIQGPLLLESHEGFNRCLRTARQLIRKVYNALVLTQPRIRTDNEVGNDGTKESQ